MHVFVPSTRRSEVKEIQRGPLARMAAHTRTRATYVVPVEQVPAYTASLQSLGWSEVEVVPFFGKGIAETRQFIGQYAEKHGIKHFLAVDDDVHWLVRRGPDTWRMRYAEPIEIDAMLECVDKLLVDFGHVGVSSREGNNYLGVGSPETLYTQNVRTLRALAYRTKDFLSVEHCRVQLMEDFDVNLQLLKLGIPNANIGYWAQGQQMTNAPGGCSTFRTQELHERSARKLAELHPGLVKLRMKSNKTDKDGFGSRLEVTVKWKAALRPKVGLLF